MKKFIIFFISSILLIALIIGQCNDDSIEVVYEEESEIEQIETISLEKKSDFNSSNAEEIIQENIVGDSTEIPIIRKNVSEQILRRISYVVSYNKDTKCPNWVAWHLTAEHADGEIPRYPRYIEDEEVPEPRATDNDYRKSGWSHGHMCPAGDNKWDEEAMRQSNLLTNMCPQNRSLNSGLWNSIEQDCRKWAKKYGDIYIACGPVLLNREQETIGANKVVVPEAFFKVVLCLQGEPKAIGYIVRNNEGKRKKDQFVNTVDEVERITGIDFFSALPDDIEDVVESTANLKDW